jgi:hypothetical protein
LTGAIGMAECVVLLQSKRIFPPVLRSPTKVSNLYLSSRPERSAVEGPAVFPTQQLLSMEALPSPLSSRLDDHCIDLLRGHASFDHVGPGITTASHMFREARGAGNLALFHASSSERSPTRLPPRLTYNHLCRRPRLAIVPTTLPGTAASSRCLHGR